MPSERECAKLDWDPSRAPKMSRGGTVSAITPELNRTSLLMAQEWSFEIEAVKQDGRLERFSPGHVPDDIAKDRAEMASTADFT